MKTIKCECGNVFIVRDEEACRNRQRQKVDSIAILLACLAFIFIASIICIGALVWYYN